MPESATIKWQECRGCGLKIRADHWKQGQSVCPECGYHGRIPAMARIRMVVDEGSFMERDQSVTSGDPLQWRAEGESYVDMVAQARERAGTNDSYIYGEARIDGRRVAIGAFEFRFLGGTLGSATGEKIARQFEYCRQERIPAVVFTASGGARMQEGMVSLMQMPKISVSIAALNEAGIPLLTVICDPTTGGVGASLAFLGDVVLAEPGALVGFAGPRVILQTIGEEMPEGVQTSDRFCADGFIDEIVDRASMRQRLSRWLASLGST